jgi:hypothetical protein
MPDFSPRFSEPSYDNPYYIADDYGGLNPCIIASGDSCIPNCVGYANGRSRELSNNQAEMPQCNAVDWFGNTSYETGSEPRLGAVMCWSGGGGYGHVAVVEAIDGDTITVSNSNYKGTRFFLMQLNVNDLNLPGRPFMGFIYNPFIEVGTGIKEKENAIYRFYNLHNGLHFMTADYQEALTAKDNGWTFEGYAFIQSGDIPVFRIYNPNNAQHHYTTSKKEVEDRKTDGWDDEGIAFMSKSSGDPIYRLYNGGLGHHFTASPAEVTTCIRNNWELEGVGWYE